MASWESFPWLLCLPITLLYLTHRIPRTTTPNSFVFRWAQRLRILLSEGSPGPTTVTGIEKASDPGLQLLPRSTSWLLAAAWASLRSPKTQPLPGCWEQATLFPREDSCSWVTATAGLWTLGQQGLGRRELVWPQLFEAWGWAWGTCAWAANPAKPARRTWLDWRAGQNPVASASPTRVIITDLGSEVSGKKVGLLSKAAREGSVFPETTSRELTGKLTRVRRLQSDGEKTRL